MTDIRGRAERLDEGIDLIRELWAGRQSFDGQHYRYSCGRNDLIRVGRPVQDPIPIWAVGVWPRPKSMQANDPKLHAFSGDVIADTISGEAGFLYWTGAKYAWSPLP